MSDVIDAETGVLRIPKMVREDEYGYRTSIDGKTVSPLTVLPLSQDFTITKSGGAVSATLKRFKDGFYSCSCPAWKFSAERDKFRKTCSHLQDVLGQNYENERIAIAKESTSNVWVTTKTRRSTSDSVHVRQAQAKSLLDNHYREQSQTQPSISAVPASSTQMSSTEKVSPFAPSKLREGTQPADGATPANVNDGSGSETEDEEQARPSTSSLSTFSQIASESLKDVPKKHQTHQLSDDDTQRSTVKKPKRRTKGDDGDDEKVSWIQVLVVEHMFDVC